MTFITYLVIYGKFHKLLAQSDIQDDHSRPSLGLCGRAEYQSISSCCRLCHSAFPSSSISITMDWAQALLSAMPAQMSNAIAKITEGK